MNETVKQILDNIRYATISTVDSTGKPWAAPVWYVYDNENIYWWSPVETQHSKNIAQSSEVYITVFDSTAPEGEGAGLYFRANATELSDDELNKAIRLYNDSISIFKLDKNNCTGSAPTRMYKAVIKEAWRNDGIEREGFYVDIRVSL